MATAKGRQVTTTKKNSVVSEDMSSLPAFMDEDIGRGHENIGSEDLETPRIKIMQALSPELETYNDIRPGIFFHAAAEMDLGKSVLAVPVYMDKRYILWNPRDSGGGILARADDGIHWSPPNMDFTVKLDKKNGGDTVTWRTKDTVARSGLANWGTTNPDDTNSPPAATLMYNYLLAFPDNPDLMPAVFTFQRSSLKKGKRFNTKLKTIRAPIFGLVFNFNVVEDQNNVGQKFYNVEPVGAGMIQDKDLYIEYKNLNKAFTEAGFNIKDEETLQADEIPDDEPDEDEKPQRGGRKAAGGKPKY